MRSCKEILGRPWAWKNNGVPRFRSQERRLTQLSLACSILSSVLCFPRTSSVSNSGGAFLRPQTATRIGWNICPGLIPNRVPSRGPQRLVQGIVFEFDVPGRLCCAFCSDFSAPWPRLPFAESVPPDRRAAVDPKKEVGDGQDIAQQLDAFADQRRDLQHPSGDREARLANQGSSRCAQFFVAKAPDVLRVQPDRLRVESVFGEGDRMAL